MLKFAPLFSTALMAPAMVAATLFGGVAFADQKSKPTVVELFTSQSCYSCPPAEKYLGELAEKSNLIALEYHVDYWDDLVYGAAGRWKDRFSSASYTARQRGYNGTIRGRSQVYTPQMIIHGRSEAVGSRRRAVSNAIKGQDNARKSGLDVTVSNRSGGGLSVAVDGSSDKGAGIWLVRYDKVHTTFIPAGENKGKTLTNHNVVREVRRIGDWSRNAVTVDLPDVSLKKNQGCAILVQDDDHGPILGAAACPS